jgi:hypothetical protein
LVLINLGIWLVIVGTWTAVSPLVFAGRVLEATAVITFAHHAWQRVVGRDG